MNEKLKVLITNSTPLTMKLIVQILNNYRDKNIIVINYSVEVNEEKINDALTSYDFKSFEIFIPKCKNIEVIKTKICDFKEDDILFFIGLENLFIDTAKNTYTLKNKNKTWNYKSSTDIDIIKVMQFIDFLYESKRNLVLLLTTQDYDIGEKTAKTLDDYDIDVLSISNSNQDNFTEIQEEVLQAIQLDSYTEAMEIIEKHKINLEPYSYRQAKISIFIKHGFSDEAIALLTDNYDSLHFLEKMSLSDLLYHKKEYHQAFNITKSLFEENPLIINLPLLLSKITMELNSFDEWYQKIISVDNKNINILDISANYFTRKKNYQEAIKLRQQLFAITNDANHLLLIEILKIEETKPDDGKIAEKNIMSIVKEYKNDLDLENEASFKLGRIWFETYDNPKKAFFYFKENLKNNNMLYSYESAKYCMKLLANQGYVDKIQLNSHPDKVPNMRLNILLDSIIILTHNENGYLEWEEFIDNAQSIEIWKKYLATKIMYFLKDIDIKLIQSYIENSSIYGDPQELEYALFVRKYHHEGFSKEASLKDMADAILIHTKSIKEKIWTRYYLAINLIVDGEMQIANNQAISLWHLANEIQDNKYLSNLSRYLGTLSWGIIQVKNHKYIEGISSIIVTIKYLIYEAKEVFPFIEDALRVLNIWIQENKVLFREKEIDLFMHLFNSLVPNQEKNEVIDLVRKEDWINIYNKLGHRIYNTQEYTSEWGLDFYNYNLASSRLNKLDLNLIMNNVQNLVTALATRIDVRAKLLYGLSDILFKYKLSEDTFQQKYEACLKLLIVSVEDTEEKRKQFTNSYERAFLSDEYRKTYKLYLTINLFLYKLKLYFPSEEKMVLNMVNTFDYLSPRTIKEKKENLLDTNLTEEIKELEKEYKILYDELSLFSLNSSKEAYLTKEYEEKSHRYMRLKKILEKQHPVYKKDTNFEFIPIPFIQKFLKEDEIYYQYVDTGFSVASLVITKEFINIDLNEHNKLDKDINILATELQNFEKSSNYDINEVHNLYFQLSKKYFGLLLNIYASHKYKKIYINPDLTKPLLSSNLIRLEDNWLIEEVDFIVNVTSKNYFLNRGERKKTNFKIANIGKVSDKQMKETIKWINQDEYRKNIFIKDIETNLDNITLTKEDSLLIVSHGVQGNFDNNTTGSLQIDGAKKSYTIDELKFINDLDCIYFLTCSSGSVSVGEHETSNSILNSILSKKINSAILCKWDVFLDVSLEISDKFITLSENKSIEFALNQALVDTLKSKWKHPVYWAGIEIWKS